MARPLTWRDEYRQKLVSPAQAVKAVRSGHRVLLGVSLTLECREVPIGRGRLDLLFRFGSGPAQAIGVEVKRGPTNRQDVGQVMDYLIPLEKEYRGEVIRLMLVAPLIALHRKAALKPAWIECREIAEERFVQVGLERGYFQTPGRR